eukprot:TRINITY_DN8222_c0_g1_i2.p1 TRINITY_DN8222_c0_g1~~TRINITY_DN8222_c0_g1_i2.p1  ORF type:complete len:374 (+),score=43.16 TRINITY_DN8222_c0_g1_i2:450-1571(+)
MSIEIGRSTRVIGWYHSHPHITVMPSHVDVRTQKLYQMLDTGFVGLIFSCFNEDGVKGGRIQVIAFQSLDGRSARDSGWRPAYSVADPSSNPSVVIGIPVSKPVLGSGSRMHAIGSNSSDVQAMDQSEGADLKAAGKQALELQQLFTLSDNEAGGSGSKLKGVVVHDDSMDLSGNLQEAMLRSNFEYSGADYVRKEIPLQVVQGQTLLHSRCVRSPLVDLQRILYTEEQTAYNQALINCTRNGKMHPLAAVHHSATYQASLAKLMEYCLSSVLTALMDKHHQNKVRMAILQEEIGVYQLSPKKTTASGSPQSTRNSAPTAPSRSNIPHTRGRVESELLSPVRSTRHSSYTAMNAAVQERQERRTSADIDLIKL